MGDTFMSDVPGNLYHKIFTNASVASNGGNAVVASQAFVAPANIEVKSAWYIPWANACTEGTATSSATYRRVNLYNGATSGTGTTLMASCNITASIASRGSKAFTTAGTVTATRGEMLYFSQLTVGGTCDDTTILQSGVLQLEYELI